MKKYLLLLLFLSVGMGLSAQQIVQYQYCDLVILRRFWSTKVTVKIDFGGAREYLEMRELRDEAGDVMEFNSPVDVLNYFGKDGWKLASTYDILITEDNWQNHYLLMREVLVENDLNMIADSTGMVPE